MIPVVVGSNPISHPNKIKAFRDAGLFLFLIILQYLPSLKPLLLDDSTSNFIYFYSELAEMAIY